MNLRSWSLLAVVALTLGCPDEPPPPSETDADADADSDTDTDADSDTDADTDTEPGDVGVYGYNATWVPPGGDWFETITDGIVPLARERVSLELRNDGATAITLDGASVTPIAPALDGEWLLAEPGSVYAPLEAAGVVVDPGETYFFDAWFRPAESGVRTSMVELSWDGTSTYSFTLTGRGRDALSLLDAGTISTDVVWGDPEQDILAGAADIDAAGAFYVSGNATQWGDAFSENLVL
ncbi:MAG: hypothetical protein KC656_18745, partial [Myxococcales bacterium]|nr:hypothetical protein [Myxococcales bacterium]